MTLRKQLYICVYMSQDIYLVLWSISKYLNFLVLKYDSFRESEYIGQILNFFLQHRVLMKAEVCIRQFLSNMKPSTLIAGLVLAIAYYTLSGFIDFVPINVLKVFT